MVTSHRHCVHYHYLVPHLLGPALQVVLVPREAVYQEAVVLALGHGALQEGAGDLYRDYGAVSDVVLNQLSKLKSFRIFSLLNSFLLTSTS